MSEGKDGGAKSKATAGAKEEEGKAPRWSESGASASVMRRASMAPKAVTRPGSIVGMDSSETTNVCLEKSSQSAVLGIDIEAWEEGGGVLITQLRDGGLAAVSGMLCVGDVVVAIDGVPCKTAPEAAKSLREAEGEVELQLLSSVPRMQSLEPMQQVAALASVRLKDGQKEYLCKWMPCARLSWVPLTEIISLDDDCMQMWEEFEASCHKVDVTICKAPGKSYGIELSGNCVVGMQEGGAALEGGELQVRDVVVGLDGDVLHDTTLAMSLAKHPEDTIMLSVVRPGEPVINQGWLAAQQARANSKEGKKDAKRAEKVEKRRAKEEEKAEKERQKHAEKEAKHAEKEAKRAAEEVRKAAKKAAKGAKKGGAKGEVEDVVAEEAEAEEEEEAEEKEESAGELSDRFKDGVRISKPDSKKSAAPPPPPSRQTEAEAEASEGSPGRTVSVSVGQEMIGRVGGPGGRRRPKGQTTPMSALSPAGEESGPIKEAGEEGGSHTEPKEAEAEDEAPKKSSKKRADDDFKAALNAKIMLGGMGAPGGGDGGGMGRPGLGWGLGGGVGAAYGATAAAPAGEAGDEQPKQGRSGAFMAELNKKVGK